MAVPSTSAVQVSNVTATLVYTPKAYRAAVTIQNLGPNVIYIGASGVTTATGLQVAATSGSITLTDQWAQGPIYALAATAAQSSPADTRVLVTPLN